MILGMLIEDLILQEKREYLQEKKYMFKGSLRRVSLISLGMEEIKYYFIYKTQPFALGTFHA
jgi:hypothetical protein